jgi:hypothetical protein
MHLVFMLIFVFVFAFTAWKLSSLFDSRRHQEVGLKAGAKVKVGVPSGKTVTPIRGLTKPLSQLKLLDEP